MAARGVPLPISPEKPITLSGLSLYLYTNGENMIIEIPWGSRSAARAAVQKMKKEIAKPVLPLSRRPRPPRAVQAQMRKENREKHRAWVKENFGGEEPAGDDLL